MAQVPPPVNLNTLWWKEPCWGSPGEGLVSVKVPLWVLWMSWETMRLPNRSWAIKVRCKCCGRTHVTDFWLDLTLSTPLGMPSSVENTSFWPKFCRTLTGSEHLSNPPQLHRCRGPSGKRMAWWESCLLLRDSPCRALRVCLAPRRFGKLSNLLFSLFSCLSPC